MDEKLLQGLARCETDMEGVMRRFLGDEALYTLCLEKFLQDRTVEGLSAALQAQSWDEAFTAAHALKGLAGNMGFLPLFHASSELVVLIRAGRLRELEASFQRVRECYDALTETIRRCGATAAEPKGE